MMLKVIFANGEEGTVPSYGLDYLIRRLLALVEGMSLQPEKLPEELERVKGLVAEYGLSHLEPC